MPQWVLSVKLPEADLSGFGKTGMRANILFRLSSHRNLMDDSAPPDNFRITQSDRRRWPSDLRPINPTA